MSRQITIKAGERLALAQVAAVPVSAGRVRHLKGEQAAAFPQPEPRC